MFNFLRKKKKSQETQETSQPVNQQNNETLNIDEVLTDNTSIELPAESVTAEKPHDTSAQTALEKDANLSTQPDRVSREEVLEEQNLVKDESADPASSQSDEVQAVVETINETTDSDTTAPKQAETQDSADEVAPANKKVGFFTRLKNGLSKTRQSFTESIASLVLGKKEIDEDLLDDLEMVLLTADVGVDATDRIISNLTQQVSRKELKDPQALITALKEQLEEIIHPMSRPLEIDTFLQQNGGPFVILMVGINGVGKTTTIGKLAKKYQLEGKSVMLAAGDTFRAAAVEQLQTWGERNNVPVMAQKTGADSAAVIFDAIQSAKAKNIDVLIADTAGRLHTQSNLMEELKKVKRVMSKVDETAPHEVMLVIDAGTGQNALNQAKQFSEAVEVSGITLTKLDGTAKGGIVYALAEQQQIPIRFIGVGESIDDLRPFNSKDFTEALFDQSQNA